MGMKEFYGVVRLGDLEKITRIELSGKTSPERWKDFEAQLKSLAQEYNIKVKDVLGAVPKKKPVKAGAKKKSAKKR